jgi:F-type H+-transporting ATPase subunit alpha
VEKQVVIIYAATSGALDELPVKGLRAFEAGLFEFLSGQYAAVLAKIKSEGQLTAEIKEELNGAFKAYKAQAAKSAAA